MKSDEIRERFLAFFESQGHMRHPSSSLVPDDPTLLTTSAGMVQFKPYFLGHKKPPKTRLTTSQKCFRAVDIEEVGRTPRHHTFFEMLGNFSFGDYFKQDAVRWAWTLLTEGYGIPMDRLKVSVYKDDDEAANIWINEVGLPSERLYHLGEDDNYWPAGAPSKGPNGPCGPCSEIFYDFGEERGCGSPDCNVACDCGRYIEIWNLVFMQFERHDGGKLTPLPKKNIDTGSGLERVASVLQGTATNFETDLIFPLIQKVEEISGVKYADNPVPMRVIADHVRGCSFLTADGVFPSNEGRGYLLRKILRRAATFGREIGLEEPFLGSIVPVIAERMKVQYPELLEKVDFVRNIIDKEERNFAEAMQRGRIFVMNHEKELSGGDKKKLADGKIIFTAYDTYGLPVEEAEKIVKEMGFSGVDMTLFKAAMDDQRDRSKKGGKMDGSVFVEDLEAVFRNAVEGKDAGLFDGYDGINLKSKVVSIVKDGEEVKSAATGEEISVILDRTPFYGEMGGQVGDEGSGEFDGGCISVTATSVVEGKIVVHAAKVEKGELKAGDEIEMKVEPGRRNSIMRHHTATHILHSALRIVLGEHVVQSGSYVGPDKLRFDFTHHEQVTPVQLAEIEKLCNETIMAGIPVSTEVKTFDEAKKAGAMALFGEKYGAEVRMVGISDFSKELCGGTHVKNTASIGLVKITDERSIGSGMRRIEALAGLEAVAYLNGKLDLLRTACAEARVQDVELTKYISSMKEQISEIKKSAKKAGSGKMREAGKDLMDRVEDVGGVSLLAASLDGLDMNSLRSVYDELKVNLKSFVVLLGSNAEGRASLILALSDDVAEKGLDAGALIKEIAKTAGGGGGGNKTMAQAGGKLGDKIPEAVQRGAGILREKLGG